MAVDGDSSLAPLKYGASQETVCGPLMFILYINGTNEGTSSSGNLFADGCL